MFILLLGISAIFGVAASGLPWYWTIPISVFGGVIGMFLGSGMEWIRAQGKMEDLRGQVILAKMRNEVSCRKQVRRAIEDTKKECGGFAIESSRAVANRVANRIIARHARGLLESEYREATLQETDEIVNEEVAAFQAAIRDESEAEKKG